VLAAVARIGKVGALGVLIAGLLSLIPRLFAIRYALLPGLALVGAVNSGFAHSSWALVYLAVAFAVDALLFGSVVEILRISLRFIASRT
jgi:hypothetical protein